MDLVTFLHMSSLGFDNCTLFPSSFYFILLLLLLFFLLLHLILLTHLSFLIFIPLFVDECEWKRGLIGNLTIIFLLNFLILDTLRFFLVTLGATNI